MDAENLAESLRRHEVFTKAGQLPVAREEISAQARC
jgi:hypothetical protein